MWFQLPLTEYQVANITARSQKPAVRIREKSGNKCPLSRRKTVNNTIQFNASFFATSDRATENKFTPRRFRSRQRKSAPRTSCCAVNRPRANCQPGGISPPSKLVVQCFENSPIINSTSSERYRPFAHQCGKPCKPLPLLSRSCPDNQYHPGLHT